MYVLGGVGGWGCVLSGERGKLAEKTYPSFIMFGLELQYMPTPRFKIIQ